MKLISAQKHTTRIQPRGIRIANSQAQHSNARALLEDKANSQKLQEQNSCPVYLGYKTTQAIVNPVEVRAEVESKLMNITSQNFLALDAFKINENLKYHDYKLDAAINQRYNELVNAITTEIGNRLGYENNIRVAKVYPLVAHQIEVSDVKNIYTAALKKKLIS